MYNLLTFRVVIKINMIPLLFVSILLDDELSKGIVVIIDNFLLLQRMFELELNKNNTTK